MTPSTDGERSGSGEAADSGPGRTQLFVSAVSALVVLALLAFVGWQLATTPAGSLAPTANVTGTETLDGSVAVRVELFNPGSAGLERATVSVDCREPPPEVTFEYVPGDASRVGTVRCPTAENASVGVDSWVRT